MGYYTDFITDKPILSDQLFDTIWNSPPEIPFCMFLLVQRNPMLERPESQVDLDWAPAFAVTISEDFSNTIAPLQEIHECMIHLRLLKPKNTPFTITLATLKRIARGAVPGYALAFTTDRLMNNLIYCFQEKNSWAQRMRPFTVQSCIEEKKHTYGGFSPVVDILSDLKAIPDLFVKAYCMIASTGCALEKLNRGWGRSRMTNILPSRSSMGVYAFVTQESTRQEVRASLQPPSIEKYIAVEVRDHSLISVTPFTIFEDGYRYICRMAESAYEEYQQVNTPNLQSKNSAKSYNEAYDNEHFHALVYQWENENPQHLWFGALFPCSTSHLSFVFDGKSFEVFNENSLYNAVRVGNAALSLRMSECGIQFNDKSAEHVLYEYATESSPYGWIEVKDSSYDLFALSCS